MNIKNNTINLKELRTKISIKSYFKDNFAIKNIKLSTSKINIKDLYEHESIKIENTEIDAFFSLNSIHVTPLVTPVIFKSIDKVIKNYWICIK